MTAINQQTFAITMFLFKFSYARYVDSSLTSAILQRTVALSKLSYKAQVCLHGAAVDIDKGSDGNRS